jgi:exonuclease SbcD
MKFLHTSDWHLGKTLKGRSRLEEQAAVLKEIADIAREKEVDAVLIAGDLYETSSPSAAAQHLLVHTLLQLRSTGSEVIAMAGNHDHGPTLDAYRPLMAAAGIHVLGQVRPAEAGGVISFDARSTGERVNVAVLPFLTTRYAVRAAEIVSGTPADHAAAYDQQVRDILAHLMAGFTDGAVNIVMAHLAIVNAALGGGERSAQTIFEYCVPATIFGAEPHYVALGHLHRRQRVDAPCPVHYSGSPLNVDFGEEDNASMVLLGEAHPNAATSITEIEVTSARTLRTVTGTIAELTAAAESFGDAYLRVYVAEPARAGLRDEVLELLPNALEVRIAKEFATQISQADAADRHDKTPIELFAEYCSEQQIEDPRLNVLFSELYDELTSSEGA